MKVIVIIVLALFIAGYLAVKLFSFKEGKFLTEEEYKLHLQESIKETKAIMDELETNKTIGQEQAVQYYYTTNEKQKADSLLSDLKAIGYNGEVITNMSILNDYLIDGMSTPQTIELINMQNWTLYMHELGRKYDCRFDSWGLYFDKENKPSNDKPKN